LPHGGWHGMQAIKNKAQGYATMTTDSDT